MAKRTRFTEYQNRYANYKFELTDDGILFMQCHTDGDSLVWSWQAHDDMSDAFADIAGDREIKVLIHTGTGENYNANWGRMPNGDRRETPIYQLMPDTRGLVKLDEKAWYARHLIANVLDVDVPMISAVNGPCNIHSEVPLMGDIVLASEDAYFQDASHFPRGQVPGDGQHVIWSFLAGHNRARYFLLTGMKLGAAGSQGVGRRQRGAAEGPSCSIALGARARAGQAAAADAAVHAPAVHQPAQARVPRRARPRPRPRDLRAAGVLPVRRRDGTARPAVGPAALVHGQRTDLSDEGARP